MTDLTPEREAEIRRESKQSWMSDSPQGFYTGLLIDAVAEIDRLRTQNSVRVCGGKHAVEYLQDDVECPYCERDRLRRELNSQLAWRELYEQAMGREVGLRAKAERLTKEVEERTHWSLPLLKARGERDRANADAGRLAEALREKPDQPTLNAARRLVLATDNAERNAALGDLVVALRQHEERAEREART